MFFPFQFPGLACWPLPLPFALTTVDTLAYQSLPTSIPCGEASHGGEQRTAVWARVRRNGGALAAFLLPWVVYQMAADNYFIPKTESLNAYHCNSTTRSIVGRSGRNVARQASRPRSLRMPIQLPTKFRASMISSGVAPAF